MGTRLAGMFAMLVNPLGTNFPFTGGFFALADLAWIWSVARDRSSSGGVAAWGAATWLLLAFWPVSLNPYRPAMAFRPRVLAPLEIPTALLAARFLVRGLLPRWPRHSWIGISLLAVVSLVCIIRLHQDGLRYRQGVEWAHARLQNHPGAKVVTDGRFAAMLFFLSGYRPDVQAVAYASEDAIPEAGTLLLDDPYRVAIQESWASIPPPSWFRGSIPPREIVEEQLFQEPRRLRGGTPPPRRVTISRILERR